MTFTLKSAGLGMLAVATCVAIGGYAYYDRHGRYFVDTNDATIQADEVSISSKLAGYVRAVPVSANQAVRAGALLVEIDAMDYRTLVSAADADIASRTASENATRAMRAEAEAGVANAMARLRATGAALAFAQREAIRYEPLAASGAEPGAVLSQLKANRDNASAEFAAARAGLTQARERVRNVEAQIVQAEALSAAARARREGAADDLRATRLTAPMNGQIASRNVSPGQFVQPGAQLMVLVPNDIYVVANFKETQVGLIRRGQPAKMRVDALPGITFEGAVESLSRGTGANFSLIRPENATGNFTKIVQRVPVRLRIDAGPTARRVLVPGMSVEVEVDTRTGSDVIEAIRNEQRRQAP